MPNGFEALRPLQKKMRDEESARVPDFLKTTDGWRITQRRRAIESLNVPETCSKCGKEIPVGDPAVAEDQWRYAGANLENKEERKVYYHRSHVPDPVGIGRMDKPSKRNEDMYNMGKRRWGSFENGKNR